MIVRFSSGDLGKVVSEGSEIIIVCDDGTEFILKDKSSINNSGLEVRRADNKYIKIKCDHSITLITK